MMSKILFFALILTTTTFCGLSAQKLEPMGPTGQFAVSQITGVPFRETGENQNVSGSPFLFDDWRPGTVLLYNGTKYDKVMLKFNALNNKFYFNRNDSVYELPDNVTEVRFNNTEGGKISFRKITSTDNRMKMIVFVQVLCSGKVPLYKQYTKRIEGDNFNNGIIVTQKKIVAYNSLWTIINNKMVAVKANKHFLEELTADKKEEVNNFVTAKKLNVKNEKDFAAAIERYNLINLKSPGILNR